MRQCWRCGGELTPYALKCSWCGRSTFVSGFFQVLTLAVLTLGALFMAGILPRDRLERYLPFLSERDEDFSAATATVMGGSAEPAGAASAGPGGYGSPPVDGAPYEPLPEQASNRPRRTPVPPPPGCDAPSAVHRLASRYPGWSRADLAFIACGRIRRGFTAGQVRAARGEPASVSQTAPGVEVWSYPGGDVTLAGSVVVAAD